MKNEPYVTYERRGEPGAPLLLTFHGTGGDEHQFGDLARELLPHASIISPRGDVIEHGAARYFRRKAEGVYDMADLALRTDKMAEFVAGKIEELKPSRVLGLGYSNGANILASVAFKQAQLFDDVMLMHPLIPWQPADQPALAKLRVLITAGRRDPICPPALTTALAGYFERQGSAVTLSWHEGGHELRQSEIADLQSFLA